MCSTVRYLNELSVFDKIVLKLRQLKGVGNISLWKVVSRIEVKDGDIQECKKKLIETIEGTVDLKSQTQFSAMISMLRDIDNESLENSLISGHKLLEEFDSTAWFYRRYGLEYPDRLLLMDTPPVLVNGIGKVFNKGIKVGIVGTRQVSEYGTKIVSLIINILKQFKCVIHTGLADGVDWLVFEECLLSNVPFCGVIPWALSNIPVYKRSPVVTAIKSGAGFIISEYDGKDEIYNGRFLYRNEILASLVDVLIVVEAPVGSGTLNTVGHALKMDKIVGVFPGSIFSGSSRGCNMTLADKRVFMLYSLEVVTDLLLNLGSKKQKQKTVESIKGVAGINRKVIDEVNNGKSNINEIADSSGLSVANIGSVLTKLELEGIVKTDKLGNIKLL